MQISEPGPQRATPAFALFNLGFRPFYLLAAASTAVSVLLWLAALRGLTWPGYLPALQWHLHEMMFGFALAVISGFLLTAGRLWTGLPTPEGGALGLIVLHWCVARVAMLTGPAPLALLVDGSFPFVVALVLLRVLLRSRNRRNYFVAALLAALGGLDVAFHLAQAGIFDWAPEAPLRIALFVELYLVVVMAGRVVPAFTASALPEAGARRQPRLDTVVLALTCLVFLGAATGVEGQVFGWTAFLCAVLHVIRQAAWRPFATWRRPILWILHLSHAWIIAGCLLIALAAVGRVPIAAPLHALGMGLLGGMVIGMITRTALGHTGRPLAVGPLETSAYVLVHLAACARVGAALWPQAFYAELVAASGALWVGAFVLYLLVYTPRLVRPRLDGRPG